MSGSRQTRGPGWAGLLLAVLLAGYVPAVPCTWAESRPVKGARVPSGRGPVVILSEEFFQTMEKLAQSPEISGDRQEHFLAQIAAAQRFLVKSHFALLEQNEKIIRLLEDISRQRQQESR